MKNIEILKLHNSLNKASFNEIKDFKFNYAVNRNRMKLAAAIADLEKLKTEMTPAEYTALLDELRPLVQAAADGKPDSEYGAIENSVIKNWEKRPEWEAARKEFEEILEKLYDQESDVELYMIDIKTVEQLPLNDEQTGAIMRLIME